MVKNKQFRRVSDILYEDRTKLLSVSDKNSFEFSMHSGSPKKVRCSNVLISQ